MIQVSVNGQMVYLTAENISLYPMGVSPYTYIPIMYNDTTYYYRQKISKINHLTIYNAMLSKGGDKGWLRYHFALTVKLSILFQTKYILNF